MIGGKIMDQNHSGLASLCPNRTRSTLPLPHVFEQRVRTCFGKRGVVDGTIKFNDLNARTQVRLEGMKQRLIGHGIVKLSAWPTDETDASEGEQHRHRRL